MSEYTEPSRTVPVTPAEDTVRPDGLAFDVEKDADLTGVPTGDQTPANAAEAAHIEEVVTESGKGPPGLLAVPEADGKNVADAAN